MIDRIRFNTSGKFTEQLIRGVLIGAIFWFLVNIYVALGALILLAVILPIVRLIWGKDPARDLSIKLGTIYGLGGSLIILVFIGLFWFLGEVWSVGTDRTVEMSPEYHKRVEQIIKENHKDYPKPRYLNQK